MNRIFISTSCLEYNLDVLKVINIYRENGFRNIELGSTHSYTPDIFSKLSKYSNCNFIVHNYFPAAEIGIVLNLGAIDKIILMQT